MDWIQEITGKTNVNGLSIITAKAKDGGVWTLVSTDRGDDYLIKPSGVHADMDMTRDAALTGLAMEMIDEAS